MPILTANERIGTEIGGRYRVKRLLGEGAFGAVFAAEHTLTGRDVALKLLHAHLVSTEQIAKRFLLEAQAMAKIRHPGIVQVLDAGKEPDGGIFLALELLEGETLEALLERTGRMTISEAVNLTIELLDALNAAHENQIVHRDIKPANIFLAREGQIRRAKILDFGIAHVASREGTGKLTNAGMLLGTPEYMAPEQGRASAVGPAADLWSMGIVLYEMLSGVVPWTSESATAVLMSVASDPLPDILEFAPDLPPPIVEVLLKSLEKLPKNRYTSAAEMRDALTAAAEAAGVALGAGSSPGMRISRMLTGSKTVLPEAVKPIGGPSVSPAASSGMYLAGTGANMVSEGKESAVPAPPAAPPTAAKTRGTSARELELEGAESTSVDIEVPPEMRGPERKPSGMMRAVQSEPLPEPVVDAGFLPEPSELPLPSAPPPPEPPARPSPVPPPKSTQTGGMKSVPKDPDLAMRDPVVVSGSANEKIFDGPKGIPGAATPPIAERVVGVREAPPPRTNPLLLGGVVVAVLAIGLGGLWTLRNRNNQSNPVNPIIDNPPETADAGPAAAPLPPRELQEAYAIGVPFGLNPEDVRAFGRNVVTSEARANASRTIVTCRRGGVYEYSSGTGAPAASGDVPTVLCDHRGVAVVPDLDNDGVEDVVGVNAQRTGILVLGSRPNIQQRRQVALPRASGVVGGIVLGGQPVVVAHAEGASPEQPSELVAINAVTGAVVWRVAGRDPLVRLGSPLELGLATGPDANGDGVADVVAGAGVATNLPEDRIPQRPRCVELLSGADGARLWREPFCQLRGGAQSVSLGPDVDGDQKGDVLVGTDVSRGGDGRVVLLSGADARVLRRMNAPSGPSGNGFGWPVVLGPDLNGDRIPELAVGTVGGTGTYVTVFSSGDFARIAQREVQGRGAFPNLRIDILTALLATGEGGVLVGAPEDGLHVWALVPPRE